MNAALLCLLVLCLLVLHSICGDEQERKLTKEEKKQQAEDDVALGMNELAKLRQDPKAIAEAMKQLREDPELAAEVKKMMEDPDFKKSMEKLTKTEQFKGAAEMAKYQMDELQKDPMKMRSVEEKIKDML